MPGVWEVRHDLVFGRALPKLRAGLDCRRVSSTTPPDVIVGWLQHDYGQLGRPAEAIAHVLAEGGLAGEVAYVEPFRPRPGAGADAELNHRLDRSLHVFSGVGTPPSGQHEVAAAVCAAAGLTDPLLLNFGVSEANWWIQYEFAPVCRGSVLVTYDKLAEWQRSRRAPRSWSGSARG